MRNTIYLKMMFGYEKGMIITKPSLSIIREEAYECKVPLADNHKKTDQYKELTTTSDITDFLSTYSYSEPTSFPDTKNLQFDTFLKHINILPIIKITTTRKKYQYNEFNIDLDSTNMNYTVGEVELVVDAAHEAEQAKNKILAFCKSLNLDTKGPIYGKVLYYIQNHNPAQYQALVDSGLIARKTKGS
jgi:hypothetical protein